MFNFYKALTVMQNPHIDKLSFFVVIHSLSFPCREVCGSLEQLTKGSNQQSIGSKAVKGLQIHEGAPSNTVGLTRQFLCWWWWIPRKKEGDSAIFLFSIGGSPHLRTFRESKQSHLKTFQLLGIIIGHLEATLWEYSANKRGQLRIWLG